MSRVIIQATTVNVIKKPAKNAKNLYANLVVKQAVKKPNLLLFTKSHRANHAQKKRGNAIIKKTANAFLLR